MNEGSVAILQLPTGDVCLQRRDCNISRNAGLLTLFGGHAENNETPLECLLRELQEEISLVIDAASIRYLFPHEAILGDMLVTLHCFVVPIPADTFEVFEGVGTETYTLSELSKRSDVVDVDRNIIKKYLKL